MIIYHIMMKKVSFECSYSIIHLPRTEAFNNVHIFIDESYHERVHSFHRFSIFVFVVTMEFVILSEPFTAGLSGGVVRIVVVQDRGDRVVSVVRHFCFQLLIEEFQEVLLLEHQNS